jgi:hypothetical protein
MIWQGYPTTVDQVSEYVKIRERSKNINYIGMTNLLGKLFIGQYGTNPGDICLVLPLTDLGSIMKDPSLELKKLEMHFLSLSMAENLNRLVLRKLETDQGSPNDVQERQSWLLDIKQSLMSAMPNILARMEVLRDSLKMDNRWLNRRRMGDSSTIATSQLPYSSTVKFIRAVGGKGSAIRHQQLDGLLAKEALSQERGANRFYVPRVSTIADINSTEYREWWVTRKPGKLMGQAAKFSGENPFSGLSSSQKEDYWSIRRGMRGPGRILLTTGKIDESRAISELADPKKFLLRTSIALPWRITCVVCGEAFVGDHNSKHTCLGVTRTSQDLGLSYRRLLYAHDLLDLPDFSEFDVDQWTDWQETDAVKVLLRHRHEFMCWASVQPSQSYLRQELWAWFTVALTMSLKINWKLIDTPWPWISKCFLCEHVRLRVGIDIDF